MTNHNLTILTMLDMLKIMNHFSFEHKDRVILGNGCECWGLTDGKEGKIFLCNGGPEALRIETILHESYHAKDYMEGYESYEDPVKAITREHFKKIYGHKDFGRRRKGRKVAKKRSKFLNMVDILKVIMDYDIHHRVGRQKDGRKECFGLDGFREGIITLRDRGGEASKLMRILHALYHAHDFRRTSTTNEENVRKLSAMHYYKLMGHRYHRVEE